MQRYRFDYEGKAMPNGSRPVYSKWMYGPSLAGVRKCPCPDGMARTVYVQGEADTYFTTPAATRIKGKYVKGFITHDSDEDGYVFYANKF